MRGDRVTDYRSRLLVPPGGDPSLRLFDAAGVLVAVGFERVEFGGRGPYLEFSERQIVEGAVEAVENGHVYYEEFRSVGSRAKFYRQLLTVGYAGYRVGMWYCSPFELRLEGGGALVRDAVEAEFEGEEGLFS